MDIVCLRRFFHIKDLIDESQFIVAYNFKWNTTDMNGTSVADFSKLGVHVGPKVT